MDGCTLLSCSSRPQTSSSSLRRLAKELNTNMVSLVNETVSKEDQSVKNWVLRRGWCLGEEKQATAAEHK